MTERLTNRLATTAVPIHPDIAARWSPRAFDPAATISATAVTALLEAARWSATWGRRQPVRFVVGCRSRSSDLGDQADDTFAGLSATLARGNAYATSAAALILVCADEGDDENVARYAALDAGAAIANLSVEAVSRGLVTHPMAGFDADAARTTFGIPEGVRPLAIVAVGRLGDYADADAAIIERDSAPRERKPLTDVAFAGTWGTPFRPDTPSPTD